MLVAAVRQRMQALSRMIGRKASVGGFLSPPSNPGAICNKLKDYTKNVPWITDNICNLLRNQFICVLEKSPPLWVLTQQKKDKSLGSVGTRRIVGARGRRANWKAEVKWSARGEASLYWIRSA
ncbi:Uncharacterized protein Fot_11011 [Forsythia ovata]|uniref:Uncharacterized protein n=1 Tax=Forsythia ovata TaxID=205694 RepID=A0ABD1WIG6_9LAMI